MLTNQIEEQLAALRVCAMQNNAIRAAAQEKLNAARRALALGNRGSDVLARASSALNEATCEHQTIQERIEQLETAYYFIITST